MYCQLLSSRVDPRTLVRLPTAVQQSGPTPCTANCYPAEWTHVLLMMIAANCCPAEWSHACTANCYPAEWTHVHLIGCQLLSSRVDPRLGADTANTIIYRQLLSSRVAFLLRLPPAAQQDGLMLAIFCYPAEWLHACTACCYPAALTYTLYVWLPPAVQQETTNIQCPDPARRWCPTGC